MTSWDDYGYRLLEVTPVFKEVLHRVGLGERLVDLSGFDTEYYLIKFVREFDKYLRRVKVGSWWQYKRLNEHCAPYVRELVVDSTYIYDKIHKRFPYLEKVTFTNTIVNKFAITPNLKCVVIDDSDIHTIDYSLETYEDYGVCRYMSMVGTTLKIVGPLPVGFELRVKETVYTFTELDEIGRDVLCMDL